MFTPHPPRARKYLQSHHRPLKPSASAHKGLSVPSVIMEYGSFKHKLRSFPTIGKYLIGAMNESIKSNAALKKSIQCTSSKISPMELDNLRAYATELGITKVGFTPVNPDFLFDDATVVYPNAMVLLMPMSRNIIEKAPSKAAEKEIFRTYYSLGKAVNKLVLRLNQLGFNAQAGPALGGESNYVMMGQDAGLGYCGKHGLLITPEYGPCHRIAVVYTDISNLPLAKGNKHQWISKFCNQCQACIKACPAKAIYPEPIIFEDGSEQHINYKLCAVPFSKEHGCTRCINSCTFFKSDYDKLKAICSSRGIK